MDFLELAFPPLPQLITVGHSFWSPDMQHFRRSFGVYDVLLVRQGRFYMTEDGIPYELGPGDMLTLEPGRTHWGHRPCGERTELYWFHFLHDKPLRTVPAEDIPWSYLLQRGTDRDLHPGRQLMYVPKFGRVELEPITPILDEMHEIHSSLAIENALVQHGLLVQLFAKLQDGARKRSLPRSREIAELAARYLHRHRHEAFDSGRMERELNFHFDYLSRCLKRHIGMSPLQYANHLRMNEAKNLLEHTTHSVQRIAEMLGFDNPNYFSRLFRQSTGRTPLQHRKERAGFV